MSFTRIPLKITRIFEIHRDTTNTLAHSSDSTNPLYSTTSILTSSATSHFGRLVDGHHIYGLDDLNNVSIASSSPVNAVLAWAKSQEATGGDPAHWYDSYPFKVLDVKVNGNSVLNAALQAIIPNATSVAYGSAKYVATDGGTAETGLIATPASFKTQLKKQMLTNLIVRTNIPNGKWYLDSVSSVVYQSGTAVNVAAGSHVIHFVAVSGYTAPADVTVTITLPTSSTNVATVVERKYTPATVKVMGCLNNSSGSWSPNGGTTYYKSGVVASLAAGDYTITFSSVSGKTSPASQLLHVTASADNKEKTVDFFAFYV